MRQLAPGTDTGVPPSAGRYIYSFFCIGVDLIFYFMLSVIYKRHKSLFVSHRRRSRSASSSGSSSSGSRSPKKAVKRISTTPPRKQVHHPDTSISPTGKNRRSPSPRARRGRGSPSPPRSSGVLQFLLCTLY